MHISANAWSIVVLDIAEVDGGSDSKYSKDFFWIYGKREGTVEYYR